MTAYLIQPSQAAYRIAASFLSPTKYVMREVTPGVSEGTNSSYLSVYDIYSVFECIQCTVRLPGFKSWLLHLITV